MKATFYFIIIGLLLLNTASAIPNGDTIYKYPRDDGSMMFTNIKPDNTPFTAFKFDCYACTVASPVDWHNTPLFTTRYHAEILKASQTHHIEPSLIQAVIHAESFFKPSVISKAGAVGLMQLMPKTAQALGVSDSTSANDNIDGGARYLSQLLGQFSGNIKLALAAYNAGPGNVVRFSGVPPFPETKAYIKRVNILRARYKR